MVSNFISLVKIDSMTCFALEKSITNNVNDLLIGVPQLACDGTSKTICTATASIINEIRLHALIMRSEGRESIACRKILGSDVPVSPAVEKICSEGPCP